MVPGIQISHATGDAAHISIPVGTPILKETFS